MCNSYFRRVSCWWNAHLCANHIIYYVPGTIFSRSPPRGSLKCDRGVKHTFSKTHFIFLASFFILFFCLAKVLDSLQITAFGSRRAKLLASLGGSLEGCREPFCIAKNNAFCIFSLKSVAKSVASQSMKMCKKHCFFNEKWLPMALPRDPPCAPSRAPFWLSVALWGLGGALGPTVGLPDCIFGLGRFVGASPDAARTISGSLLRGRTPVGVRRFLNSRLTQRYIFKFRFP